MNSLIVFLMLAGSNGTPLLGGPKDCPVIWKAGAAYHMPQSEIYWKEVLNGFEYKNAVGAYAKLDLVLLRFVAPEKYKYVTKTHAHLEFVRKAQEYLHPKGIYMGYYAGFYNLNGSAGLGEINTEIITPAGVALGILWGKDPAYPYFSLSTGASFVTEAWDLTKKIGDADSTGSTKSTGFWGKGRFGLLWQLRGRVALDISLTYSYLTLRHTEKEPIPSVGSDKETIAELRPGIGLIFAMPWRVEETWR